MGNCEIKGKIMKNIIRLGILALTLIAICTQCFAITEQEKNQKKKTPVVAVISDRAHRNGTTYLICGSAADIIATDIINALNQSRRIKAPLLGDTMAKITNNQLNIYKDTFFREYSSNYNIDFVNLKRLTRGLNADYILMVTSGLDIQSSFLKDTWWNKLNISGMDVVRPTYKLSTLLTLIDCKTNEILWQDLYIKDISAKNFDIGAVQFSPGYAQLSKIKKYSTRVAEHVVPIVDKNVNPELQPPEEPKTIELKKMHVNEDKRLYYPVIHKEEVKKKVNKFSDWVKDKVEKEPKKQNNSGVTAPSQPAPGSTENLNIQQINAQPQPQKQEIVQPVIYKQPKDKIIQQNFIKHTPVKTEDKNIKPAVNKTDKKPAGEKTELEYPLKAPSEINPVGSTPKTPPQPADKQDADSKEQLPLYDWNLKNIYLKEIGVQTFYEKQADANYKL